ncbi:OPA3-like protein [Sarcoptes scabiei]|nr:OPA3-like protein [Sarcoptes scabiei]
MARISDENSNLIELFAEIAVPRRENGPALAEPWILRTYPNDYSNKEVLSSVPYFAYPCAFKCDVITHFSFVLTNIKSKWTFGYCRHTPDSDTCLLILSDLPWHSTFFKILDHCAELAARQSSIPLERFLEALYNSEIPQPGLQLNVTYTVEDIKLKEFSASCPDHQKLPCIPEDRNITEYYNAISPANMITIFASMLNERRIVMVSEKLNRLSACVQAANTLIYPMQWQHIFIPLLPNTLMDYLTAPMPFLIGVPQETFDEHVKVNELGEIVLLNVDTNQLTTPFDDVSIIPSDVLHQLRKSFKNSSSLFGDGLCRAFLKVLVMLIGGYREALRIIPGEEISFDREAFVANVRGTSKQLFLDNMLQLQIFQQFIESRLDMFNRGERFTDQFEIELNHNEQSTNSRFKNQYHEWTSTMKKEGGALIRAVNPKVKSAISKGRQAIRQVRQKISAQASQLQNSTNNFTNQTNMISSMINRPNSEPSSPKLPPIIKKSISGNFMPTQTSRTVRYVRNPRHQSPSTSSASNMVTKNSKSSSNENEKLNSSNLSIRKSLSNGINNSQVSGLEISESSEAEDNDHQNDLNRQKSRKNSDEELENIFRIRINEADPRSSERKAENGFRLALPPPRSSTSSRQQFRRRNQLIDDYNGTESDANLMNKSDPPYSSRSSEKREKLSSTSNGHKCLIEFDSPPKEIRTESYLNGFDMNHSSHTNNNHQQLQSKLNTMIFDPLLEDVVNNHHHHHHNHHDHNHNDEYLNSSSVMHSLSSKINNTLHVSNSNFYAFNTKNDRLSNLGGDNLLYQQQPNYSLFETNVANNNNNNNIKKSLLSNATTTDRAIFFTSSPSTATATTPSMINGIASRSNPNGWQIFD